MSTNIAQMLVRGNHGSNGNGTSATQIDQCIISGYQSNALRNVLKRSRINRN